MDNHISPIKSIFLETTGGEERLSNESEWKNLKQSLVKLGLVFEEDKQCQFQKLWHEQQQSVVKGRNNNEKVGKNTEPACVTLELIENLAFQLYPVKEEIDTAIQSFFNGVAKQVKYFQDLLESWDLDRLDMKQAVQLIGELHFINSKLASCIQVIRNVMACTVNQPQQLCIVNEKMVASKISTPLFPLTDCRKGVHHIGHTVRS